MTIRCVPKTYGFAHVCDGCGATGPVLGDFPAQHDVAEALALGLACRGPQSGCSAAVVGWLTGGERDLCPACRAPPAQQFG